MKLETVPLWVSEDWRLQSAGAQAVGGYSPSGFGPENNIGIMGSFKHDIISSYIIITLWWTNIAIENGHL